MKTLNAINNAIIAKEIDLSKVDPKLALMNTKVLDLVREACLIESYFGLYISHMLDIFRYDLNAAAVFTIEAYEAYSHYIILNKYLEIVDYKPIQDDEIIELRKREKATQINDEIKELVNFMGSEHFSSSYFNNLAVETQEPVLKKILTRLAGMEVTHAKLAYDLLEIRLNKNPNLKEVILEHAKNFQHIGKNVLPSLRNASEDNITAIREFNTMLENLVGESLSSYKMKNE